MSTRKIYNVGHNVKEVQGTLSSGTAKVLQALGFTEHEIQNVHSVYASAIQLGMMPSGRQTVQGFARLYKYDLTEVLNNIQSEENVLCTTQEIMSAKAGLPENRFSFRYDFSNPKIISAESHGNTDYLMTVVPFIYDDSKLIDGRGCVNMLTRLNILELEIIWKEPVPADVQEERVDSTKEGNETPSDESKKSAEAQENAPQA